MKWLKGKQYNLMAGSIHQREKGHSWSKFSRNYKQERSNKSLSVIIVKCKLAQFSSQKIGCHIRLKTKPAICCKHTQHDDEVF